MFSNLSRDPQPLFSLHYMLAFPLFSPPSLRNPPLLFARLPLWRPDSHVIACSVCSAIGAPLVYLPAPPQPLAPPLLAFHGDWPQRQTSATHVVWQRGHVCALCDKCGTIGFSQVSYGVLPPAVTRRVCPPNPFHLHRETHVTGRHNGAIVRLFFCTFSALIPYLDFSQRPGWTVKIF